VVGAIERDWGLRITGHASLAGPLTVRLHEYKSEIDAAKSRQARVRGAIEAARHRVAELSQAVNQIDRVLSPEIAEEAA
jgi:hypothetical protein